MEGKAGNMRTSKTQGYRDKSGLAVACLWARELLMYSVQLGGVDKGQCRLLGSFGMPRVAACM